MIRAKTKVVRPDLLRMMRVTIGHCEVAGLWRGVMCGAGLHAAHIQARGMGGGKRRDVPDNIAIMCPAHHRYYDQTLGQSRGNQDVLRAWISWVRLPQHVEEIQQFYEEKPMDDTKELKRELNWRDLDDLAQVPEQISLGGPSCVALYQAKRAIGYFTRKLLLDPSEQQHRNNVLALLDQEIKAVAVYDIPGAHVVLGSPAETKF
jgi:hypothetical protein